MNILHSDLNNFYASVECLLNPELKDKYMAVCGNEKERHGIVLAKNQKAKLMGVQTAEPIWKAKQKCPELITVPPHPEQYRKYSKAVREIYARYTDLIEPFGLDECWLDVSKSHRLFGSGEEIANRIRETVKKETGLTVSVGVSFNKIFAKLGSDMKKPDAVTVISRENFKEKIWHLGAGEIIGVGKSTQATLEKYKIVTIGDIANSPPEFLCKIIGKYGTELWKNANGLGSSHVAHMDEKSSPKSIGHGATCVEDLKTTEEVWKVIYKLSVSVEEELRRKNLDASGVCIEIKNPQLKVRQMSAILPDSTRSAYVIAKKAYELFMKKYCQNGMTPVRSVTVRVNIAGQDTDSYQLSFFDEEPSGGVHSLKTENVFYEIRQKLGKDSLTFASLMGDLKMPGMSEKHFHDQTDIED